MVPVWYFGPVGDLHPLPAPEGSVNATYERLGGIHQALSGARTVDTFGHRATFEFDLPWLLEADFYRLDSLQSSRAGEELHLLNPLRRNLIHRESATSGIARYVSDRGLRLSGGGALAHSREVPAVAWVRRSVEFAAPAVDAYVVLNDTAIPVPDGEPVTVSVYVRTPAAFGVKLQLALDSYGTPAGEWESSVTTLPVDTWTRVTATYTPTPGMTGVTPRLVTATDPGGATVLLAAPQLELGESATDPTPGGGLAHVAIDSLDVVSPRFPYHSATLKLLEV